MGDIFFYAVLVVPELLEVARANVVVVTEMVMKAAVVTVVAVAVVATVAVKVEQMMELL
jgi:hypothetical protein